MENMREQLMVVDSESKHLQEIGIINLANLINPAKFEVLRV